MSNSEYAFPLHNESTGMTMLAYYAGIALPVVMMMNPEQRDYNYIVQEVFTLAERMIEELNEQEPCD